MTEAPPLRARLRQRLASLTDDSVLRWLFSAVLAATLTVAVLDYRELSALAGKASALPGFDGPAAAPLPEIKRQRGARRGAPPHELEAKLRDKMTFDLVDGGRLVATGTIAPGTAEAFAAEVEKRGGYIKTVTLQSPGGSVQDALAMGRLIRARNFDTEVGAGHYCASSCPLVFAGGKARRAGEKAAIGVHQVFAVTETARSHDDGMANAQRITATAQSYLRDMGVDLGVWLHAMETPKDELYYFTPAELLSLKLATEAAGDKAVNARAKRGS